MTLRITKSSGARDIVRRVIALHYDAQRLIVTQSDGYVLTYMECVQMVEAVEDIEDEGLATLKS